MKELGKRLKNPGTIITLVSAGVLIATTLGIKVDNEAVMKIVQAACTIGISLGVLNNPTSDGVYPFTKEKEDNKK